MKATRVSEWRFELDNEAVKAIRFVMGYNTDLRVSLRVDSVKGATQNIRSRIWDFINNNLGNILGIDFMMQKPDVTDEAWNKYESCLNDIANQVIK